MLDDFRRTFDRAVEKSGHRTERKKTGLAYPGKRNDDDTDWVYDVPGRANYKYVRRVDGDETSEDILNASRYFVRNPDMPLQIKYDPVEDEEYIAGPWQREGQYIAGDTPLTQLPAHTHGLDSANPDPVEARRILPGLVYSIGGMNVRVNTFPYMYQGQLRMFPQTDIDLTSAAAAITDGFKAWVALLADPDAQTLSAAAGTEQPQALPSLDSSDVETIVTVGQIPLSAVALIADQTAAPAEQDFIDIRHLAGAVWGDFAADGSVPMTGDLDMDGNAILGAETLTLLEVAAPSAPASGKVILYAKSDGKLYAKDDVGTEYDLAAAGTAYQIAQANGTPLTARGQFNFVDGVNTTASVTDDAGSNRTNVTFNAVASPGGGAAPSIFEARLTLTTALPVTTADVTAATTVYLTPYHGNYIGLYDGADWDLFSLSEVSIKLTDTQTGTTTNTSTSVTGLTDTSQFIVGMEVTGTGIPGSTTISSVDSGTAITLSNAATGSASVSLTFKVPANRNLDLFLFSNAGTPKLEMTAWTNDTTRATALTTQNGIYVKTGATTRRYVGTVRTTATAGQTEDSQTSRFVWNAFNRKGRSLWRNYNATTTYTYNSTTWRQSNAVATNKVSAVIGLAEERSMFRFEQMIGGEAIIGIGLNSTSALATGSTTAYAQTGKTIATLESILAVGSHDIYMIERVAVGSTARTFYSTYGTPALDMCILNGMVMA